MSDTPRTDAFEALVNRPTNWWDFASALERENAALRSLLQDSLEWLDDYGLRMSGTSNLVSRIETVLRKKAQP